MINSLVIQNYQSHKNTQLDFCKGVNVIIGDSNSGKSAIVRALYFGTHNKPAGNSFCSNWGGKTLVEIFCDGTVVSHIKEKNKNVYILDVADYKAFGQGVPEDIQDTLNIADINYQFQMDKTFILSMSPGEIAKYFNKVVNLGIIDSTLKNVNTKLRKVKSEKEYNINEVIDLEKELEDYKWLDSAEQDFYLLEKKQNKINKRITNYNSIVNVINQIEELEDYDWLDSAEQAFSGIQKVEKELTRLTNINNKIVDIYESINKYDEELYSFEKEYEELSKRYKKAMGDKCPLCEAKIKEK